MAKSYYLVDELTKDFDESWEKNIVSILHEPLSKEDRIRKILLVLKEPNVDLIVSQIPKRFRVKSRKILDALEGAFKLDDNLHIIYPSGEIGGSIIDHLKFVFLKNYKPEDASKFEDLMRQANLLKSAPIKAWRVI